MVVRAPPPGSPPSPGRGGTHAVRKWAWLLLIGTLSAPIGAVVGVVLGARLTGRGRVGEGVVVMILHLGIGVSMFVYWTEWLMTDEHPSVEEAVVEGVIAPGYSSESVRVLWPRVEIGMSEAEVRMILGSPNHTQVFETEGSRSECWYYGDVNDYQLCFDESFGSGLVTGGESYSELLEDWTPALRVTVTSKNHY